MRVQNTSHYQASQFLQKNTNGGDDTSSQAVSQNRRNAILDLYTHNTTLVHIGGGAMIGAGLARVCGLPDGLVMSAAGSGAVAGFFAGSPRRAALMTAGAAVGATIGTLAGLPGSGVMSAVGTSTLVAWLFSK